MTVLIIIAILLPIIAAFIKKIPCIVTLAVEAALALVIAFSDITPLTLIKLADGLTLTIGADVLSKVFGILIAFTWLIAGIYMTGYMAHEDNKTLFTKFWMFTLSAMLLLTYAQNYATFFTGFEAMTLLSMPLVIHDRTAAARKAAIKYLGFSIFGAAVTLVGFFALSVYGGSTEFNAGGVIKDIAEHKTLFEVLWLISVVGFGAKAGLVPLHSWLPVAHPEAPSPASAVLSGVITKCGVLAIIRVTYYLFGTEAVINSWAQYTAMILALLTVFTGSMMALKQKHIKRRLAYSTVSQVSYALFGLFLLNSDGFTGAIMQVVFHMLAKDALFMWAGAVIHTTGVTSPDELTDFGRKMPGAMWAFTIASLSLIGIPPAGGFVSKLLLAEGSLSCGNYVFGIVGVAVLIISALLTAGYLMPITARAFFPGKEAYKTACAKVHIDLKMLVPMLIMAILTLAAGIFTSPITDAIAPVIKSLF